MVSTIEPVSAVVGDTWAWTKSLPDYPSSTWTLSYFLRGVANSYQVSGGVIVPTGLGFAITIPASTTAAYVAALYTLYGFVTSGSARYQIYRGEVNVTQDQATTLGSYDGRTHAEKMVTAIESMLEGTASREEMSYTINAPGGSNRAISFFSRTELLKFYGYYKRQREAEISADRIANGLGSGRKIYTRFLG